MFCLFTPEECTHTVPSIIKPNQLVASRLTHYEDLSRLDLDVPRPKRN